MALKVVLCGRDEVDEALVGFLGRLAKSDDPVAHQDDPLGRRAQLVADEPSGGAAQVETWLDVRDNDHAVAVRRAEVVTPRWGIAQA